MAVIPPQNFPDVPADPREIGSGPQWWSQTLWPWLQQRIVFSYDTVTDRDAELAGLGPSDRFAAYVKDFGQVTRWNGSRWLPDKGHSGSAAISASGTATAARTMTGVFPTGLFTAVPSVVVSNAGSYLVTVSGISATAFTVTATRPDGGNITSPVTFFWNASQQS